MSVLTVLPPAFTTERVAAIIGELYGLAGTLSPLASERDQNFHLREAGGRPGGRPGGRQVDKAGW
jgi:Ser/Thr protein kinase RdoA (MazF antagonist)